MKTIYLVHGWGGSDSSEGWFGWLKDEAGKRGFKVVSFNMPNSDEPTIEGWVGFLKEKIKNVDEETYFVGHSIGCQAILRFLEGLPDGKRIGGCVFVAGWFNLLETAWEAEDEEGIAEEKKLAEPWIKTPIDFGKVKQRCNNFVTIFSDNDPCVPLTDKKLFEEKLGAKTFVKHGEEHFNETERIDEIWEILNSG